MPGFLHKSLGARNRAGSPKQHTKTVIQPHVGSILPAPPRGERQREAERDRGRERGGGERVRERKRKGEKVPPVDSTLPKDSKAELEDLKLSCLLVSDGARGSQREGGRRVERGREKDR